MVACSAPALGATQISQVIGPDGPVGAISDADANGVRYIGGDFTAFNPWATGNGAAFDTVEGIPDPTFPKVSGGSINAVAPDGSGGFYIGGAFTCVGALNADGDCSDAGEYPRSRVAHIRDDGSVDASWNPSSNNRVTALAVLGSTVYAGGDFTTIGGQSRSHIAALGAGTGAATSWNPGANDVVLDLAASGSTVYAGGSFTTIGGQSRRYIAAISTTTDTNNATSWNPHADSTVMAMQVDGSTVYVGGYFTTIGGQSRNRIAAISTTSDTNNATAWNPGADSVVRALAVSGSTVFAGGSFTTIGGQPRNCIAAISTTSDTNNATSWNPNADSTVYALQVVGSTVFAAGQFTTIGGQPRRNAAALSTTSDTGTATAWKPNPSDVVTALAASASHVYAGGQFTTAGGNVRPFLAALDADGYLTDWSPGAAGPSGVKSILLDGSTIYVGGQFTSVGGSTRTGLAAVSSDGTLQAWNPPLTALNSFASVRAMVKSGTNLFVGGFFISIGGVTRGNIAAVSTAGSCATTFTASCVKNWNPATNGGGRGADVLTLNQVGGVMLLGGPFSTVDGINRSAAAAVGIDDACLDSYTSACVLSWNPDLNERITALEVVGDTAYIGGWFTQSGNTTRTRTAAVKIDSSCITSWSAGSCLTAWNPGANNQVPALGVSGTTLYAAGMFTDFGSQTRNRAASVSLSGACATTFSAGCLGSWSPDANNDVRALRTAGSNVYLGGDFTALGGVSRSRLAIIGTDGTLGPAIGMARVTAPSAPTSVMATASGQAATVAFTPGASGGSYISAYTVTCTSATGGATRTGTGAQSPITVADLTPGATYTCAVTATNDVGTSAASATSAPFTVEGGAAAPSASSGSAAPTPQSSDSPARKPSVRRLRLRQPPTQGPPGTFVTTGVVPTGATSVVQIARGGSSASGFSRGSRASARPRTSARVAVNCPIARSGKTRTFTCRIRLGAGAWTIRTRARKGATVVASASNRVVVKASIRTAVTG